MFTPACAPPFLAILFRPSAKPVGEAAEREFDVFVTIDRQLEHQIDLRKFALGFVIIRVASNTLAAYLPSFDRLQLAAETVCKGDVIHLDARSGH